MKTLTKNIYSFDFFLKTIRNFSAEKITPLYDKHLNTITLAISLLSITYFIYITYYYFEYRLTKKLYIAAQKIYINEKLTTQKLIIEKDSFAFLSQTPIKNENEIFLLINNFKLNNNPIKLTGFIPNNYNYQLTFNGEYLNLIHGIKLLLNEFIGEIHSLEFFMPENEPEFSLHLQIHLPFTTQTHASRNGVTKNLAFKELKMTGYLSYGIEHWGLVEDASHTSYLIKEGENFKNGFIETIQKDHVLITTKHNGHYLVPLTINIKNY